VKCSSVSSKQTEIRIESNIKHENPENHGKSESRSSHATSSHRTTADFTGEPFPPAEAPTPAICQELLFAMNGFEFHFVIQCLP
jgi:hypothetical protein